MGGHLVGILGEATLHFIVILINIRENVRMFEQCHIH